MTKTDSVSSTSAAPAESIAAAATAPVTATTTNGFSITALVLGIAGIALGQWLLSVAAIVFGFVARNREPARLMANWGLVLGFVGVFGGILLGIIGAAVFAPFWLAGLGGWDVANIGNWDVWGL